jgi:hypothetical protein
MQSTAKVQELLQVLKDRGMNEDAVKNVQDGLWEQASEAFLSSLLTSLTQEELQNIASAATQEEANAAFRKLYQEKTGKDMDEEMQRVVDQQATTLIEKYKVAESGTEPVVSESTDGQSETQPAAESPEEDKVHDLT